ncbi:MAG: glycosyltransferase [Candidatus Dormibacteria bacterium]
MAGKRILFSIVPGSGHLNPIVAFARALESEGHEVRVASTRAFGWAIRAAGLTPVGHGPDWDGREAGSELADAGATNPLEQLNWLVAKTAVPAAEGIAELAREWRPDLIIRDNLSFGGWLSGDELGIPVAVFALSAPMPAMVARMIIGEELAAARATRGLAVDDELSTLQGVVTLDTTPPSLEDGMSAFVTNRRPLRPVQVASAAEAEAPAWLADLVGRPILYVTMGTVLSHNVLVFQKIAAAVAALDVDVVMTIGISGDIAALGELPANVRVARYIDQDLILDRASAVVCHAGRGTAYGSLTAGLPMCLVPLGTDQPLVAAACERAGVAVLCTTATVQMGPNTVGIAAPEDVTVEVLRAGIERALTDPGLRRRAGELAAEIAAMPAPAEVAADVASLMSEAVPAGG